MVQRRITQSKPPSTPASDRADGADRGVPSFPTPIGLGTPQYETQGEGTPSEAGRLSKTTARSLILQIGIAHCIHCIDHVATECARKTFVIARH